MNLPTNHSPAPWQYDRSSQEVTCDGLLVIATVYDATDPLDDDTEPRNGELIALAPQLAAVARTAFKLAAVLRDAAYRHRDTTALAEVPSEVWYLAGLLSGMEIGRLPAGQPTAEGGAS